MAEYKVNEKCIIGMPSCGYGFSSSRSCFFARPSDDDFQLEEDILSQILKERNYRLDVALSKIDPGNFAFCTKICSQIIQSHFCMVLLNRSKHRDSPDIRVPNPNVHLEYGMMLSFHKHIIPMQREEEVLAFNIYPLDTVKYRPGNFKDKAEQAVDDAILRIATGETASRPIGAGSDLLKYLNFNGLQYADITSDPSRALFQIGGQLGFNLLFDIKGAYVFFGFFEEEEPREIVVRSRLLLRNGQAAYTQIIQLGDLEQRKRAEAILRNVRLILFIPENAPAHEILDRINEYQVEPMRITVSTIKPSEVSLFVKAQYESIIISPIK